MRTTGLHKPAENKHLVEIFHFPGRGATVHTLLSDGLKPRSELIKEGKLEPFDARELFSDHLDSVFFRWVPPHLDQNKERYDWVSIKVDPETTYVYNQGLRAARDKPRYRMSGMTLARHILQHEKTAEMRKTLPVGHTIIWHPVTADPLVVPGTDPRVRKEEWQYLNEIVIRETIPPSKFNRHHHGEANL